MRRKNNISKIRNRSIKGNKKETQVAISFPDEISTELVQANDIRHYEIFSVLATLFSSAAVGFWTASFGQSDSVLKWVAGVFTIFTILFIAPAVYYRQKIFHGSTKKKARMSDFK
jgi:hypothetical protein